MLHYIEYSYILIIVNILEQTKALASAPRMAIIEWLKAPRRHFAQQDGGDPAEIGVAVTLLADKLSMKQPTVSRHLDVLRRAGLVTVERRGTYAYFRRDEKAIAAYRKALDAVL